MNMFARFDENPAMTLQDIKETKRYGRTDARTDGQRENSIPTTNKVCGGIMKIRWCPNNSLPTGVFFWIDFILIRGDSWGFIKFFLQSWCSTRQSRFRYDFVTSIRGGGGGGGNRLNSAGIAKKFIMISKITLDHAARKLRNQLRIS